MTSRKAKKILRKLRKKDEDLHKEATVFDLPWSVPYEFSAAAMDDEHDKLGRIERFWCDDDHEYDPQ